MRAAVLILASLTLAGCAGRAYPSCTGWERLTPTPKTQAYIVNNDQKFAGQVLAHENYGQLRGCW